LSVPGGVLLVTRNLPPLLGGMERLNLQICRALAEGGECHVVGPEGSAAKLPPGVVVREIPIRPLSLFVVRAAIAAWQMAARHRPSWVLAGSGLTAPMAWLAAIRARARSAVYAHGLDLIVPSSVYRALWIPIIRRLDLCLVNSRHTAELAQGVGIAKQKIVVINPGVDQPAEDASDTMAGFRTRHGLGQGPILLSVGRLTRRKGLSEFVANAFPRIAAHSPTVQLVVIGDYAPDALTGGGAELWQDVMEVAGRCGVTAHVHHLGVVDDDELAAAYREAVAHVFPVRAIEGDIEGFGMVALEAASRGTPTIAFSVGGVPDAIGEGQSGMLIEPGNYDGPSRQRPLLVTCEERIPSDLSCIVD